MQPRFEVSVLRSHPLLCCYRRKNKFKKKKQLVPPPSIYIHMCTLYTYTNTYIARFSPSSFFGPSRCLVPSPGLTSSNPCAVCVCVLCVYTHKHTDTLPPASKIEKTQDNTLISPSVQKKPPRQATSPLHSLAEPPHPCPSTQMNKLRIREHTYMPYGGCVCRYIN